MNRKPTQWAWRRGATAPEWDWFWRNCKFCIPLWEGGGAPYEIVRNNRATVGSTPTWQIDQEGRRVDFDGTDYYEFPHHGDYSLTGRMTLVWYGVVDTGSTFRHFIGKHAGNGALVNPFDFRTDTISRLVLVRANTNNKTHTVTSPTITLGARHLLSVSTQTNIETVPDMYVDGVAGVISTTGTGTGVSTSDTSPIRVGQRADGIVQLDGKVYYVAGFDRRWTPGEHSRLARDPFGPFTRLLLTATSGRRYAAFVAVTGGIHPLPRRRRRL